MKYSKLYLASAALLFAGLVIFLIGFAMLGFDIRNFDTEPAYVSDTYTASGATKEIIIEEYDADIKLNLSKDEKVHIKYYENGIRVYDITDVSGIVTVTSKQESNFIGISVSTPTVTVSLPEGFGGAIKISNQAGNITADDITAAAISAETENGYIRVSGTVTSGNLELETDNGNIELYNINSTGTVKLLTDNGNLFVQKLNAYDMYAEADLGHLTLADVAVTGSIFGECDEGDTQISEVSVGSALTLIADNGDIRGSVTGADTDYSYNCDARNGTCNLPADLLGGKKQLNIRTENGDIEIYTVTDPADVPPTGSATE